ncbi:hypothetical protein DL766_003011 [Monosporascus sp. MC13-8B]|uniref:RING-type domain-containing protein n=1 Tax=Monosporascus cannonballus TaxID=155416 RepID=A0ABY0H711_9PEZI|nr:hypothetical protein DL762_004736 [Monosporascus cannonballus]RYO98787.1 hypothetical protein DL763_002048 [Monosporascus cannonballus]RYP34362.1 hypothetical protein DL766_003011 [Monosporascus sp. MC13-8B]
MVLVDHFNYNTINGSDTIAYMSCDTAGGDDSYISPDDMLNALIASDIEAILLYSTVGGSCSLGGSDLESRNIWTMTDAEEAYEARNDAEASKRGISATITSNQTSPGSGIYLPPREGSSNSAVAMSILYSITGIITLLFLVIISSGAIRAHRHPERYGPRPSFGGRPRQSRAKGLARAVLDTIPIVKFGDSRPAKPDPEHELESTSGDRQDDAQARSINYQSNAPSEAHPVTSSRAETLAPVVSQENRSSAEGDGDEHVGCSICTEDFTVGEDVRLLPCDHKFHPQCVDPWLVNVSGTCPLCRLDLRRQATTDGEASPAPGSQDGADVDGHLAAPVETDVADINMANRRRISRLLDWNRLRHASVDERIQALRQYRQTQQAAGPGSADDQSRHTKLTDRLREKFHIRTRRQSHPPDQADSGASRAPDEISGTP